MSARSAMTHRAYVVSNTASGNDDWNNPVPAVFELEASADVIACRAWSKMRKEIIDGDKTAIIEDVRAIFPLSASITEDDRITNIKDRQGTVLFSGPFDVLTIAPTKDHIEVALDKIKS